MSKKEVISFLISIFAPPMVVIGLYVFMTYIT